MVRAVYSTIASAQVIPDADALKTLLDAYGPLVLAIGALVWAYMRAQKSPHAAASKSIMTETVDNMESILDLAQRAFDMAKETQIELDLVRRSANRCEHRNAILMRHNILLSNQVIEAGHTPVAMPSDTLFKEDLNG